MIDELVARDEASAMFRTFWESVDWSTFGANGTAPAILWEGRDDPQSPPPLALPYARYTFDPSDSRQGSLAGDSSTRLWDEAGLIVVQSFGPLSGGIGLEVAEYMAIMAKRAYQGKQSENCMWFRNCRTQRIGISGAWFQYNTIIEFFYNDMR